MEIEYIVSWVILIAVFGSVTIMFIKNLWSKFDHSRIEGSCNLQSNASITTVNTEKVQYLKGDMKFKTTVRFSDGFVFTTHDTNREDGLCSYCISYDSNLKRQIIENAVDAHNRALENQKQKEIPKSIRKLERKLKRELKKQLQ